MLRLLISLFLVFGVVNATSFTYPDFKQCYKKNLKSFVYFGDIRAVAVTKHLAVAYSKVKPKVDYIKYDPFLNLYLFYSKKPLKPVRLRSSYLLKVGEWVAGMDDKSLYVGNFASNNDMIDSIYLQNANLKENSIISCLCCEVYGLGVGEGKFIGSELIRRFMHTKGDISYGDIGVRFTKRGDSFFVSSINPFYKEQPLKVGDKILRVNGKEIFSLKQLRRAVLFAKPNSKLKIKLLRGNALFEVDVKVFKKISGGVLGDSFLEKRGIYFDEKLQIKKVSKDSFASKIGLKKGDKLLMIDGIKMENEDDLKSYLSNTKKGEFQLLFDRDDFQFFVHLRI
jgi:hypothetical protein